MKKNINKSNFIIFYIFFIVEFFTFNNYLYYLYSLFFYTLNLNFTVKNKLRKIYYNIFLQHFLFYNLLV